MSSTGTPTLSDSPIILGLEAGPGQGSVVFPEGFELASADYGREGMDLVVTDNAGTTVVVEAYFSQDALPTLNTPDGAAIDGSVASLLAGPMAPGQVAQMGSMPSQEPIGQVDTVEGTVTVTRADGTRVELTKGDPVFEGDVLETGDDSGVGIMLADTSVFSLGEGGRMVMDEMVYDPGAEEGSASFSLLTGAATFVSGQIAKFGQDAMMVKTPVATIGIRGTKVYMETDGETFQAVNLPENTMRGESVGEIVLMTPSGEMLGTINHVGGGWQWTPSEGTTPSSFQLSDAQVRDIVQQSGIHLPRTIEEQALDVLDRVEAIRTEAEVAREEGDLEKAEELDAQALELEIRLEEALDVVEGNLGYELGMMFDEGGDEDFDLDDFGTDAGGTNQEIDPTGDGDGGSSADDPFADLFNEGGSDDGSDNQQNTGPAGSNQDGGQDQNQDDGAGGQQNADEDNSNPVTDPLDGTPTAVDDSAEVAEGQSLTGNLIANDSFGSDGFGGVSAGAFVGALGGTLVINADGTYDYTAPDSADHSDGPVFESFQYTITDTDGTASSATLTIELTDTGPVAVDDADIVQEGLSVSGTVLGGAEDDTFGADGAAAAPVVAGTFTGEYGTLVLNGDGSYTYTADGGADHSEGLPTDTFTYTITDADGSTDTAELTFVIGDDGPQAVDDAATLQEGAVLTGSLVSNDDMGSDGFASITAGTFTGAQGGTLEIAGDGTFTYTAPESVDNSDGNPSETFFYLVTDGDGSSGLASFTVELTDAGPAAADDSESVVEGSYLYGSLLDNDDFGDDGIGYVEPDIVEGEFGGYFLTGSDGTYLYLPPYSVDHSDGNPTESFEYTIFDADGTPSTATFSVEVTDDGPVAVDLGDSVTEGQSVSGNVLNDSFFNDYFRGYDGPFGEGGFNGGDTFGADGAAETPVVGGTFTGEYGTLVLSGDGSYTYTANDGLDHSGGELAETFTYTIVDGDGSTGTAELTIQIGDDGPVAVNDSATLEEGQTVTGDVLGNDDFGSDGAAATQVVNPGSYTGNYGTLVLNGDGSYTYTADDQLDNPDQTLTDTFTYTIADADGSESSAQLTVEIAPNTLGGTVVDGYIANAIVYVDADGDGQFDHNEDLDGDGILDEGEDIDGDGVLDVLAEGEVAEDFTYTNENGEYTLTTFQDGSIRTLLGTDVTTGLDFFGSLSAPAGATVVTPLTTLIDTQINNGIDPDEALANVLAAMDLDAGTDVLNIDPQARAEQGDVQLMAKGVMVANTLAQMTAALESAGVSGDAALALAIDAMSVAVENRGNDGDALDLTSGAELGAIVNGAVNAYNAQLPEDAEPVSPIAPEIVNGMSAANRQVESLLENYEEGVDPGEFLGALTQTAAYAQGEMTEAIRDDRLDDLPQSEDAFSYAADPQGPWVWADGKAPGEKPVETVREREPNHIDEPQAIDRGSFGTGENPDQAEVQITGRLGTYNTDNRQEYNDAFTFEVKEGESLSLSMDAGGETEMRIYAAEDVAEGYDHLNPPPSLDPAGLAAGTYVVMVLNTAGSNTDFTLTATLDLSGADIADRFDLFATRLPEQEQNFMRNDGTVDTHQVDREEFGAVSGDMAGITLTGSLADYTRNNDKYNDAFEVDLAAGEWITVSHPDGASDSLRFQLFKLEADGTVNTRMNPIDGVAPEDGSFSAYSPDGGSYVIRVWSEGESGVKYEVDVAVGGPRSQAALADGELTDGLYFDESAMSAADLFRIYANEVQEIESNYVRTDGRYDAHEVDREEFGTLNDDMSGVVLTGKLAAYDSNPNSHNDAFSFDLAQGEWVSVSLPDGAPESLQFQLFQVGEDGTIDTEAQPIDGWGAEDGTLATQATGDGTFVLRVWDEGNGGSYELNVAVGTQEALTELAGQPLIDNLATGDVEPFEVEALVGSDFDDLIIDGLGDNFLTGGDGADVFQFAMDDETDVITDFSFDDVLQIIGEDLTVDLEITPDGDPVLVVTDDVQEMESRIILQGVDAEEMEAALSGNPESGYSVSNDPDEGITVAANPGMVDT